MKRYVIRGTIPGMIGTSVHPRRGNRRFSRLRTGFAFFLLLAVFPLFLHSQDEAASAEEAHALFNEAVRLYNAGDRVQAAPLFAEAAEIYDRFGEETALYRLYALSWTGLCRFDLGDLDGAVFFYGKALALAGELDQKGETARLLSSLGSVHIAGEDHGKALEHFTAALQMNEALGNPDFVLYDLNNIGNVLEMTNRRDEAAVYYARALEIMEEISDPESVIGQAAGLAQVYDALGRHREEIAAYETALRYAREIEDPEYESIMLGNLGLCHGILGEYERAMEYYRQARTIILEIGDDAGLSRLYANMSILHLDTGRFDEAILHVEKAFAISREIGLEEEIPTQLDIYGQVYEAWGRFDEAHDYYSRALALLEQAGRYHEAATLHNNLGSMYEAWGRYDTAVEYYEKALRIYEEYEDYEGIAVVLNNLGQIYRAWQEYEWAREAYQQSLEIHEALGLRDGAAIALSNLGEVHRAEGDYDRAIGYYEQALHIDRTDGRESKVALRLNNIGLIHSARGDTASARDYFLQALAVFENTGQSRKAATVLNNIGISYYDEGRFAQAAEYLLRSIEKKEILRLTAEGEIRRDYLASQIATYRWLVSAYINGGQAEKAFDAAELSSAKYLLEQMGKRLEEGSFGFSGISAYRRRLGSSQAIVSFINLDWHTPDEFRASHLVVDAMVATSETLYAVEIDKTAFLREAATVHRKILERTPAGTRGFTVKAVEPSEEVISTDMGRVIDTYRLLLADPNPGPAEQDALNALSRSLYDLLFAPIEEQLSGKTELMIIPEGALAIIPFETLRLPDGRYLVEKYAVRYAQSLAVAETIESRRVRPGNEEPRLLLFGGAVYDTSTYQKDMFDSEREFANFKQETLASIGQGASARGAYEALDLAGWTNLPGTLAEVRGISELVPGSTLYTGRQVNETLVKELSADGLLKSYRVVHFATHGIVVPDFPQLSALVLSLDPETDGGDDGYLTMGEITDLQLNADFVNLSACETGLGALYGGEGVVGLTQAFLVAGANGLSVSLWQVADRSTMEFMLGLYALVQRSGLTYHEAMTEMKRRFIREGSYRRPFYWAPFVYYGL